MLNLVIKYLPTYESQIWDYKKENNISIKKAPEQINWHSLHQQKQVHEQVLITNSTIQKQPPRGVLGKRCSENIQQIYRRTPMPKRDFNFI